MLRKVVFITVSFIIWLAFWWWFVGVASASHTNTGSGVYCDGHEANIVGTEGRDIDYHSPRNSIWNGDSYNEVPQSGGYYIWENGTSTFVNSGQIEDVSDGQDVMHGLGGHDDISAVYGGPDIICGGPGGDDIYGYAGADRIFAGQDNDSVEAMGGDDYVDMGGTGDYPWWWRDTLEGGNIGTGSAGYDTMLGGWGRDGCTTFDDYGWLSGDWGNDSVYGLGGDDCLSGELDDDYINGGVGYDTVARVERGEDVCVSIESVPYGGCETQIPRKSH